MFLGFRLFHSLTQNFLASPLLSNIYIYIYIVMNQNAVRMCKQDIPANSQISPQYIKFWNTESSKMSSPNIDLLISH